ncbi:MAG: DUF2071 domain-containing protein [Armatimonadota bacterium]
MSDQDAVATQDDHLSSIRPSRPALDAPLRHLAMVTYAVRPDRIERHLPPGFLLETRSDERGTPHAFVSVVMFQNHRTGPTAVPWLRSTYLQVNYRTYIRYQGAPGAWFFIVMLQSRMAMVQRALYRAPAYTAPMDFQSEWDDVQQRYRSYRLNSATPHHGLRVEIEGDDGSIVPGPLFSSTDEMVTFLTRRFDGYFADPRGRQVSQMTVWHEAMRPKPGTLRGASFGVLDRLGLVPHDEQRRPYAVFLQPSIHFVGMYPRRLRVPAR